MVKGINTSAKIMMKILEVGHWVAAGLMTAVAVLSVAAPQYLKYVMDVESLKAEQDISAYGLQVTAANAAGELSYPTLLLFAIGAVVIFVLMALVFRNLHGIIQNAETTTPFSAGNIRRLKKVGIYSILVPLTGFAVSAIIRLVVGTDGAEVSMDLSGVIMGTIVLCLTQYFIHGAELEKDVDGLL